MSALDPQAPEGGAAPSAPVPPTDAAAPAPEVNGTAGCTAGHPSENGTPSQPAEPDRVQRAEEMVDHIAERVSDFTSRWGRRVVRVFARIKEEAEDMWGEAQSIRRGDQP